YGIDDAPRLSRGLLALRFRRGWVPAGEDHAGVGVEALVDTDARLLCGLGEPVREPDLADHLGRNVRGGQATTGIQIFSGTPRIPWLGSQTATGVHLTLGMPSILGSGGHSHDGFHAPTGTPDRLVMRLH